MKYAVYTKWVWPNGVPSAEEMQARHRAVKSKTKAENILHVDFVFVRHQSGTEVTKAEWMPSVTAMMESSSLEFSKQRRLYENSEIIAEHSFMKFPDGTSEAVLVVNHLKDGKILRVETGATPIK
jgi:hypothetical protein